jgi:sugar phosphate isomerase/epimerase
MFPNLNTGMIGVQATLPEAIAYAKKYGFRGVEFSIREAKSLADKQGIEHVRGLFRNSGIRPGCWGFPVEYRKDEATWRDGLKELPELARLAQDLDCLRTATWILPCDDERDFAANFRFYVERLRPAAHILRDYGCRVGLEFIGPKTLRRSRRYAFIHTLDGMRALAADIGTGNVGILLDIWHLYTSHGYSDDIREMAAEEVVTVHINDAPPGKEIDEQLDQVRTLPGETGVLNVTGFLQALQAIGYDGPVTAEPFSQRVRDMKPEDAVAATAEAVLGVWNAAGLRS